MACNLPLWTCDMLCLQTREDKEAVMLLNSVVLDLHATLWSSSAFPSEMAKPDPNRDIYPSHLFTLSRCSGAYPSCEHDTVNPKRGEGVSMCRSSNERVFIFIGSSWRAKGSPPFTRS